MRQDHRASRKKSNTPPVTREDIGKSTHVEVLKTLERALELHRQGNLENSKSLYLQALALNPENFDTLHLLGCLSNAQKDYTVAVGWFSKALKINALNAACFSNLGVALRALKKFSEALFCYDQAITLNPNFVDAHSNRCNVLLDLKRFSEALASADRAVNLDSEHAEALNNRGNVYLELADCAAAIDNFKLATKVQRNFSQAYFNLAVANLLSGNFRDGWESYESRWQTDHMAEAFLSRKIGQPLWSGKEALRGKTLFVFSEQGFGDTIQFCRYISPLAQQGAKIIFEVQAPLFRLLSKMNEFATVIIKGDIVPDFDYYCPLLSVPARLNTDLESIPQIACSIFPDEKTRNCWQFKLGEPERPRIGLVWSGSATHVRDANRSISLTQFIKHLPSDFEYISLQKDVRDGDVETLNTVPEIKHFGGDLEDFQDTAALCELVDIVISVDTSVAHLAASLGKPTWVLIEYSPDWRWMLNRTDSPWYPSVTLFRQEAPYGDWSRVLNAVGDALREVLKLYRG